MKCWNLTFFVELLIIIVLLFLIWKKWSAGKKCDKESKSQDETRKIKKTSCGVCWVWVISIVALAFSLISIFCGVAPYTNWNVEIVSLTIILGFVGILATFVVISNYAQVVEIKNEFGKRISAVENLDERIKALEEKLEKKEASVEKLGKEIDALEKRVEKSITWG
jgi:amino acid transporter